MGTQHQTTDAELSSNRTKRFFSNQLSLRPVRALLNPMIFNNELFWQKVHHVNDQQLSFMYPVQFSHHGKELLCFYPDLKQLIEHHICHIPNLHSILLECVHDENGKALVNELFSQIKLRAILDPQKFNNETFWNHCHTLNCDELDFNQSSLYSYQNSMILCDYPELRQVVEKNWQHQPYLHFYLSDCALTTDAVNEVEQIFSSLQKNPVSQSIMPVYFQPMLGQIGFNDSSSLYFKLLAGVLTAAAGASSLVLAITTFNLLILSVSGIIAASVGVSSLVASGMFFKSAYDDYKEPSQFQI